MTKDEMTADNPNGTYTREFQDATGGSWLAVGVDDIVAHGKMGVRLAFRPMEDPEKVLPSRVTFNSREAADFALRTLGLKELQRRLTLAQAEAGAV